MLSRCFIEAYLPPDLFSFYINSFNRINGFSMSDKTGVAPDVLMLLGTHCPHCPAVLMVLSELIKRGSIASLQVVNLEQKPALAEALGVRSVPWVRIGWFELEGLHSKSELEHWVAHAAAGTGADEYLRELLGRGQVQKVMALLRRRPQIMREVISLMHDAEAKINVRLGIGVLMEEFAARRWFEPYIDQLAGLCQHEDARVRSDATHYLSLTGNPRVVPVLRSMLQDANADVIEAARDGLEGLGVT